MTWLPIVLSLLALVVSVLGYWDTHRVANHTLDTALRPVILMQGYIEWDEIAYVKSADGNISGNHMSFAVMENTAQDIEGYIIKDGRKYQLLFGNEATTKRVEAAGTLIHRFVKQWGWIPGESTLFAIFDPSVSEAVSEPNQIYIAYKDIEGNPYTLTVDASYVQRSARGDR